MFAMTPLDSQHFIYEQLPAPVLLADHDQGAVLPHAGLEDQDSEGHPN